MITGRKALDAPLDAQIESTDGKLMGAVMLAARFFNELGINSKLRAAADGGETSALIAFLASGASLNPTEARRVAELLAGDWGRARGDRADRFPVRAAKRRIIRIAKLRRARILRMAKLRKEKPNPDDAKHQAAVWAQRRWGSKFGLSVSTIESRMGAKTPKMSRDGTLIAEPPTERWPPTDK